MDNQIINTMAHQVRIALRLSELRARDFLAFPDGLTIQFTIKENRAYLYKIAMAYNEGADDYSLRMISMYIGEDFDRPDWMVAMVTDWVNGIYWDMLRDIIEGFYDNRAELDYHDIAEEM